jgi:hypothetical protein
MSWEESLWAELDQMEPTRQIIATGELIAKVNRRRDVVCDLLGHEEWDATKLAEQVGARRGTILRLAQEGRSRHREQV